MKIEKHEKHENGWTYWLIMVTEVLRAAVAVLAGYYGGNIL